MSERRDEQGSTTLPAVAGIGILLVAFVLVAQFALWLYARGALRASVQAGARAASVLDAAPGSCEQAFERVRVQLLGGSLGAGVGRARCVVGPELVVVEVDARFDPLLAITPGWDTTVRTVVVRERGPA